MPVPVLLPVLIEVHPLRMLARAFKEPKKELAYTIRETQVVESLEKINDRQLVRDVLFAWISTKPRNIRLCVSNANCKV